MTSAGREVAGLALRGRWIDKRRAGGGWTSAEREVAGRALCVTIQTSVVKKVARLKATRDICTSFTEDARASAVVIKNIKNHFLSM